MKPFEATHRINADWDESECLVMKVGNHFGTQDVWEEGGRWETEKEINESGYSVEPII